MNDYEFELAHLAHAAKLDVLWHEEHAAREAGRPFMLLRPKMFPDGDQWCALYGDSIQDGVCAFGNTPAEAAEKFDDEWRCGVAK